MKNNTRKLAETAVLLALGTVLSFVKVDMPMGGGMTICSMLPLIVVSWRYGWKWGYSLRSCTVCSSCSSGWTTYSMPVPP